MRVRGGRFVVEDRSLVFADNTGATDGSGGIDVEAGAATVDGRSGITIDVFSSGHGGPLTVRAGEISVTDGGRVRSSAFEDGDAGTVTVEARGRLYIDRAGAPDVTGILSETRRDSSGRPGAVAVRARAVELRGGGVIRASTLGAGAGGAVKVEADDHLTIDGAGPPLFTGIASQANNPGSGGAGGKVAVRAGELEVRGGGAISSSTFAAGAAGAVTVDIDGVLRVRDGGRVLSSSVGAGSGRARDVVLSAGAVLVDGATIRTEGRATEGGLIRVVARHVIGLAGAEVTSNGILPAAGASIITLRAPAIAVNHSTVTSLTGDRAPVVGSGEARLLGDTTIISDASVVAASSTVEVTGLQGDLSAQLVALPSAFLDASSQLAA